MPDARSTSGPDDAAAAPTTRCVMVLVESSAAYGRACLRGIARYARNHGCWLIRHMPHDQMPVLNPNIPWRWEWDGVIARIASRRLIHLVRRLGLPTVDLMGAVSLPGVMRVESDDQRIVAAAIEHLLSIGHRHLAYCGVTGLPFSDLRQGLFETAAGHGPAEVAGVRRHRHADLPLVAEAGGGAGGVAGPLQRGQQQRHEQRDDADDDEQLDEGEGGGAGGGVGRAPGPEAWAGHGLLLAQGTGWGGRATGGP